MLSRKGKRTYLSGAFMFATFVFLATNFGELGMPLIEMRLSKASRDVLAGSPGGLVWIGKAWHSIKTSHHSAEFTFIILLP